MSDIAINPVTRRVQFTGNTGTGPFAFTFNILAQGDIAVYKNTTLLTLTADYTVTINANGTGSITLVAAVVASDVLTIIGGRLLERTTDFVTAGDLLASSLNEQLDSNVIMAQQLDEKLSRGLFVNPGDVFTDLELPLKDDRKGKTLSFNETSGDPEPGPTAGEISNAQTYATNAAASAAAAATSETNAATSATSAAGSATTATTKASEASTSATNASTAQTAAETAQTAAETAETNAETAETNAATSETNAATSAATATTQATTATTKASEAAASAAAAATSETNAATSASGAATSATSAATSAANAAAAFDSFDDKYLGSKTGYPGDGTGPTVDNDGNPLVEGALFFSADANEMRVYDGSNWIAASSSGTASLILYEFTATSGQTTFSGADDNGATLGYTALNIQVVMNGVILDPSDYTASNGTSVVLGTGAATGDLINVYAFASFTVADTVSASSGGTFAGGITVQGSLTASSTLGVTGATTLAGVSATSATVNGTLDIEEVYEKVTVQTSTTGTITFDTTAQAVELYTADQTANRTINFSNVNANLAIGQSLSVAVLLTNGATPYYLNVYQVDGSAVTPKWQGGTAPSAGNASGIDSYNFTIIKTADATFTVLASQTQFA
jgi:chemotaxis protein histidine kinase CheA